MRDIKHAAFDIDAAFAGDVDAAERLAGTLPIELIGNFCVFMWQAKIPRPAFQKFIGLAWGHDPDDVIAAARTKRRARAMFRYACLPIPETLGGEQ